ncbi:MAG: hypothetical protein U1E83_09705 [Methylotetracoccus sp.]
MKRRRWLFVWFTALILGGCTPDEAELDKNEKGNWVRREAAPESPVDDAAPDEDAGQDE